MAKPRRTKLQIDLDNAIGEVMSSESGRLVIYHVLHDLCGMFQSGGNLEPQFLAAAEGKREVGSILMNEISRLDKNDVVKLLALLVKPIEMEKRDA